jgi:hypothetical protein
VLPCLPVRAWSAGINPIEPGVVDPSSGLDDCGGMRHGCVEFALPWSGAAKCLAHGLIGPRRIGVSSEGRLILVRRGNHRQQTLER